MAEFRLSKRARERLVEIYAHSELLFGQDQSDAYLAGFLKIFELIAAFPGIGRSADELRSGYRRYRHQSHYVFYTFDSDSVLIETIIHVSQELRPDLFD